jgi:hypothetical protein
VFGPKGGDAAAALGEVRGGKVRDEVFQGPTGAAAVGRETEPDKGLETIVDGVPPGQLGVGEAEVVLGDGVSAHGLGAEGGEFSALTGKPPRGGGSGGVVFRGAERGNQAKTEQDASGGVPHPTGEVRAAAAA